MAEATHATATYVNTVYPNLENVDIARRLDEVADLLEAQRAISFRVQAYRRAANAVRRLPQPLHEIWREHGEDGLRDVTGVGERLATSLRVLLTTGRLPMLDRLRGETDPVALIESVPGIGQVWADRLYSDLGIHSLEDLEVAAHDGRLADVAGFGRKRIAGISDSLAARLGRVRFSERPHPVDEPSIEELLDVDREYRSRAAAGELPKIAPRRFNPEGVAWLPILHTERGDRHYTALFSNTARAHQFDRTHDWVVLYCDHRPEEFQATVVTAHSGALSGKRVVRGREAECEAHYALPAAR